MGDETDEPKPGFNHWESFKGQGVYYNPTLNINGKQAENYYFYSEIIVPEGDMAFYEGNLLIVWYDKSSSTVYGISYDLNGKKSKEKFAIGKIDNPHCIHNCIQATFVNPQVEAGKYFMVAFDGKIFLYDKKTLNQVGGQKTITLDCQNDMAYGDGKYLVAQDNDALFLDEEGNKVGEGTFGGHSDVFTHLAYGNKMFVGIVAIHTTDDGIGASFLDYNGKHLIDTLPLAMPESPGWAAYDW